MLLSRAVLDGEVPYGKCGSNHRAIYERTNTSQISRRQRHRVVSEKPCPYSQYAARPSCNSIVATSLLDLTALRD
jgi:hypothetical protein